MERYIHVDRKDLPPEKQMLPDELQPENIAREPDSNQRALLTQISEQLESGYKSMLNSNQPTEKIETPSVMEGPTLVYSADEDAA